ncbi:MAG: DNA-directed RNA polymerase subunit beta' [Patescibacteria group bacterium]|nr:DNA-directed RNA polymerase subunit beta' [Patescibacteria group bacterium]MDD5490900.1 DNA-directed RNA polymerase subunit beta' [Patescibacteria group bacterium]
MIVDTLKSLDFNSIRLKLASPEEIHNWSYGEISRPETINYRTQKPEKGGLFAEEIFGPSKDWQCYCGKYKKIRYKGIICDKCGVEVTHSLVRRERMGHIDLASPVSHIWFLRGVPSRIGLVLDLSVQSLEKVVYFASFIITEVNEEIKAQTMEQLKQEFKSKGKILENDFERQANELRNKLQADKKNKESEKKITKELANVIEIKEKNQAELKEEFETAERELKELVPLKIISENDYQNLSLKYGHVFEASIGGEAMRYLLSKVDLGKTINILEKEILSASGAKKDRLIKRSRLLKSLQINKIRPEWMVLTTIPVIPPDLRPMVPLDGGRFATSDLNDLYRRVINRNNRLKRLLDLNAPEVIVRNEKRMLQEAVDALLDNSARQSKTVVASTGQKRQLKSIADILRGKQGRFRQNLLGKRTDYSGRSVIIVGPNLKLHQCGLPKKMALELFKPFIISQLIKNGVVHNIRSASRYIEAGHEDVWDILGDIVKDARVLLNRAPTLHRLGIQAFQPVLIEGKAIQVHPLVCPAFNADFDGDQMAVHVPLTEEAKVEAREIISADKNLLKPATGNPVVNPGKDISWGIYYITSYLDESAKPQKYFSSKDEAVMAYQLGKLPLREKIKVRVGGSAKKPGETVESSVGRLLFNDILPPKLGRVEEIIDTKKLAKLVRLCLEYYGLEKTVEFLDKIKELGFYHATLAGYSWGMDDLPTISKKQDLVKEGNQKVDEIETQYAEGLLTSAEKHVKIIEVWTEIKDRIVKECRSSLNPQGPVFSMVESGSRGSWGQLTQMIGMKGLVSSPSGEIIELPVKANFKEGFGVLEYFISTHGARKGLSDTALRTANAGYLTRRLVDVAQDVIVNKEDCGDKEGVVITKEESEEIGEPLVDRIAGRFVLDDVVNPKNNKVIVPKGEAITEAHARELAKLDIDKVRVRSVLTCKIHKGVCAKCYGYDLGHNKLVELGTPVGIIAAQSIGEPGTQLTMRTFHTGGVAGQDITQGLPRVEELFEARSPKKKALLAEVDGDVTIEEADRTIEDTSGKMVVKSIHGQKTLKISYEEMEEDDYKVPAGAEVAVKEGQFVDKGNIVFIRKDHTEEIRAKRPGMVKINKNKISVVTTAKKIREYIIPPGYGLFVKNGDKVKKGDQLTEGDLDLHQLFVLRGKEDVKKYLVKEIQHIYSSQGQKLNDKHIEVIIRQLFSRVIVRDTGDTDLLPGEVIEKNQFEKANEAAKKNGGKEAKAEELFLGITKVSLSTESFLSAASFQETARVLIEAAITGKVDRLEGLKENVIIGRVIPAGTGFKKK